MRPRAAIIRWLLAILNSKILNGTPCKYGFIGNVDAFSIDTLRSEVRARPGLTVARLIAEAEQFASCPINKHGLTVIENGVVREGTVWDVHELRQSMKPEPEGDDE